MSLVAEREIAARNARYYRGLKIAYENEGKPTLHVTALIGVKLSVSMKKAREYVFMMIETEQLEEHDDNLWTTTGYKKYQESLARVTPLEAFSLEEVERH